MSKKFKNPIDPPKRVAEAAKKEMVELDAGDSIEGWFCNGPAIKRVMGDMSAFGSITLCLRQCSAPSGDCRKVRAEVREI